MQLSTRTLCVTLVLGLAADTDQHVRSAAVRALGCYVLYPCLREVSRTLSDFHLLSVIEAHSLKLTSSANIASQVTTEFCEGLVSSKSKPSLLMRT